MSDDIVDLLRSGEFLETQLTGNGHSFISTPSPSVRKAADTIEALRAENARLERLICRIYSAASNIDADKLSPGIIENIAAIVHANRNARGESDE